MCTRKLLLLVFLLVAVVELIKIKEIVEKVHEDVLCWMDFYYFFSELYFNNCSTLLLTRFQIDYI